MASRSPLPPGLGVELDRAVRLADEGHLLVGGDPIRAVRLTSRQVSSLIRWMSGMPVRDAAEGATAAGLIAAGLAHPSPSTTLNGRPAAAESPASSPSTALNGRPAAAESTAPSPDGASPGLTADIFVIDRGAAGGLTATLDRLAELHPGAQPIVVGATGPATRAARERGARVLPIPLGGAAARALALTVSDADLVALVDAGHLPRPGWLEACAGHFADPDVAAVLPRTLLDRSAAAGPVAAVLAAVAASRSGPDRGPDPAPVLPWGHTAPDRSRPAGADLGDPLRPVTALVLRRSVMEDSRPSPSTTLNGRPAAAESPASSPSTALNGRPAAAESPASSPSTALNGRPAAAESPASSPSTALNGRPAAAESPASSPSTAPGERLRCGPSPLDPGLGAVAEHALLWSLVDRGLSVRHEPRSRVLAPAHTDLGGYLRACAEAGAGAARLARLRGNRAAGPELSPTGTAALAALLAGRPLSAAVLAAVGGGAAVAALAAAGAPPGRTAPAVAAGLASQARAVSRALRGAWWPPAAAALTLGAVRITRDLRRGRRPEARTVLATAATAAALVVPHPVAWRTARGTAPVDPLTWTVLGIAGDAARGLGAWWGMARSRSVAPLLPRVRLPGAIEGEIVRTSDPERREEGSRDLVSRG
ncbi:hypothetical protein SUDANB121_01888 [Nocardiopsis dassonvillei]|uniref:family 2 glycosyl transferase n=1 Tax=Nocardiopsis dassonvillei TaxID=2014 RepID=UPI003F56274A